MAKQWDPSVQLLVWGPRLSGPACLTPLSYLRQQLKFQESGPEGRNSFPPTALTHTPGKHSRHRRPRVWGFCHFYHSLLMGCSFHAGKDHLRTSISSHTEILSVKLSVPGRWVTVLLCLMEETHPKYFKAQNYPPNTGLHWKHCGGSSTLRVVPQTMDIFSGQQLRVGWK